MPIQKEKKARLRNVLAYLEADEQRLEEGRKRMEAVWEGEEPDCLPLILPQGGIPERESFASYDMEEQFYDPELMLIEHLWSFIGSARTEHDGQLAMRANLGTGFIPTVFDLEQQVFTDKMPWLTEHLEREELESMTVEGLRRGIEEKGLVSRALEYYDYFRDVLADTTVNTYLNDTQGPFDIAHLIYGDQIFIDMYDAPDFVHHLMELTTTAYIEVSKLLKEATDEPLDGGYHNQIFMSSCGVRCCEDSTTLISGDQFQEFVLPYIKRVLEPFGGGWVHFCGSGHQFLDELLAAPEVRGVNFGNPERYEWPEVVEKLVEHDKVYYGLIPQQEGESPEDYFRRILEPLPAKKHLILQAAPHEDCDWPDSVTAYLMWRGLQEEM